MSLVFAGKTLSCIAATGTIGAVAVLPKIKSTLASLEKDIVSNSLEDLTLSPRSSVTEITTSSQNAKTLIKKVTDWLKDNGGCKISLAIGEKYYEIKDGEGETDDNRSLFASQSGMQGKSKFERLADDLENNRTDKTGKDKYSKYLEDFKTRCKGKANQTLKLQWRSQIPEKATEEDNTHSDNLEGLMNLWVDEKDNVPSK